MFLWLLSYHELQHPWLFLSLRVPLQDSVFPNHLRGALWRQHCHTIEQVFFFFLSLVFTSLYKFLVFHWRCTNLSLIWLMILDAGSSPCQFHVRRICSSNTLHSAGMLIFRLLLILLQRKLPASSPLPCSSLQLQSPIVCLSDCCADCALTLKPPYKKKKELSEEIIAVYT